MAVFEPRFCLLGPFELVYEGRPVQVGGPVAQAVLAALASSPNTKLLPGQLTAAVWGTEDAATADSLYHYVSRLRRALAPVGLTIVGHRPGYRLPVTVEQVDAARFDELLRTARALSRTDPDHAVRRLDAALRLWRGQAALDNLTLPGIRRLAVALDARRLDAEEDLADLELHRGRPELVLDRLRTLAAAHPGRPRLTAALARALHATGRAGEARRVLADAEDAASRVGDVLPAVFVQVGRMLADTPVRTVVRPVGVPFQLPADTAFFTGRSSQVDRLLGSWPDGDRTVTPATAVSVVEGMAGIGKTALTVHVAHRLAGRFCDGVLFVDLHGFTPGVDPIPPERALDHLLRGLGVPGDQIPPDLDARVALYRTVLARRRVMIVLDNAKDHTQIAPLLPSSPGCRVIVTSRRHLAGLDDATHLTLPTLDPAEAADLFRGLVSDRVTPDDFEAIEQIVARCGYLPLAIRITAARLRFEQASTPARLVAELDRALGSPRGLDWLSDGHRAVTASLDLSWRCLTTAARHAFGLLGLYPGPSVEPYALAALANTTVDVAQGLLYELHAASLVQQPTYRHYTLHDLVAAYAATHAGDISPAGQQAALGRLYDHHAHASSIAMDTVYPDETDQRPPPPATGTAVPALGDTAREWLDDELDSLLAIAHHAGDHGRADHLMHQSATLHRHLRTRGRYTDAEALHRRALDLARDHGDHRAELAALNGLGHITFAHGRYEQATDHYQQALAVAQTTGDPHTEPTALNNLGDISYIQGQYEQATDYYQRTLDITRTDNSHRNGEQGALAGVGRVLWAQGRHAQATDHFERALHVARATGNRNGEQYALTCLSHIHRVHGRYEQAEACCRQVLDIANKFGDRNWQFEAHHGIGRICFAAGDHDAALTHHHTALDIATELGHAADQVRAHDGAANAHLALGSAGRAQQHWKTALDTLVSLGTDHTEESGVTASSIRTHLANLTPEGQPLPGAAVISTGSP